MIQGGDITARDGTGGRSAFGQSFMGESPPHSRIEGHVRLRDHR